MNRAERRRQAKLTGSSVAKDPIISMKKSDIDRIKREAAEEATETAMVLLLSIPIKVMHEQFGWGMKRDCRDCRTLLLTSIKRSPMEI